MRLDVVIPTFMREDKLKRALSSVRNAAEQCGNDVDVKVKVCYSCPAEYLAAKRDMDWPWLEHCLLEEYPDGFRLPRFWNDALRASKADAVCYLTDDVLLNRYCLAIAAMEIKKMDFDGVVGFVIENHTEPHQPCQAAFGIIGMKYADRFPERQVFFPGYRSLYADMELQQQAQKLGKFKFHQNCLLVHFHPNYTLGERDDTHVHTRREFDKDRETFEERNAKGLIWGLVNA